MKYIITSLLILFTIQLYSQAQDENFYLSDSKISWNKAYKTDKTKEQIFEFFENSSIFKVVKIEKDMVLGRLEPHATDPKITGVAGVPEVVNKNDFKGDVNIQYRPKEKEYIVSFTNLTLVGRGDFMKKREEQSFETHYLIKGKSEYRRYFLKRPKKVYNATFTPIFEMK